METDDGLVLESIDTNSVTMTRYDAPLKRFWSCLPKKILRTLGEAIANAGLTQLRMAETEKYLM